VLRASLLELGDFATLLRQFDWAFLHSPVNLCSHDSDRVTTFFKAVFETLDEHTFKDDDSLLLVGEGGVVAGFFSLSSSVVAEALNGIAEDTAGLFDTLKCLRITTSVRMNFVSFATICFVDFSSAGTSANAQGVIEGHCRVP
jgi:hypothetical protein